MLFGWQRLGLAGGPVLGHRIGGWSVGHGLCGEAVEFVAFVVDGDGGHVGLLS